MELVAKVYFGAWGLAVVCGLLSRWRMKRRCRGFYDSVFRSDLSMFSPAYSWHVSRKTFLFWRTFRHCPDRVYIVLSTVAWLSGMIVVGMLALLFVLPVVTVLGGGMR